MASWGEIAVGEVRRSANYPGKSAIAGLLGAALGVNRDDDGGQKALWEDYALAVKLHSAGTILKDYHTTQAPDSVGKFVYRTRRDALTVGQSRLGTTLSSREYRMDAQAIVALSTACEEPRTSLGDLKNALLSPKFHLYLGRKACPIAAPLNPQIMQARNFKQALDSYIPGSLLVDVPEWARDSRWLPEDSLTHYYWEGAKSSFADESDEFSTSTVQELLRRDLPSSRRRWQFKPRKEFLWIAPEDTAKKENA